MKPEPIRNFDHVILFSLQRKLQTGERPELSFSEIWSACEKAAPNFMIPLDPKRKRRQFMAEMFDYIKRLKLETKINIVTHSGDKIERITLTDWGKKFLSGVVYTNQHVMGN